MYSGPLQYKIIHAVFTINLKTLRYALSNHNRKSLRTRNSAGMHALRTCFISRDIPRAVQRCPVATIAIIN